jgi:hypothetical protein
MWHFCCVDEYGDLHLTTFDPATTTPEDAAVIQALLTDAYAKCGRAEPHRLAYAIAYCRQRALPESERDANYVAAYESKYGRAPVQEWGTWTRARDVFPVRRDGVFYFYTGI